MRRLDGRIAIVTGAGQGVGRGIALVLAKDGATVAISEINADTAESTANEIKAFGGHAMAIVCDVSQRKEVNATVAKIVKKFGTVDILVNNAQAVRPGIPFEETTDDIMDLTLHSGIYGTLYFMQACFPYMKEKGGKIINLGSASGLEGHAGLTAYAVAKEGIRALTKVAAHEWGIYKINVNTICPFGNSPSIKDYAVNFSDHFQESLSKTPLGRVGDCEKDIGPVVAFLAGPESDFVTGMTIMVDGGQCIMR